MDFETEEENDDKAERVSRRLSITPGAEQALLSAQTGMSASARLGVVKSG